MCVTFIECKAITTEGSVQSLCIYNGASVKDTFGIRSTDPYMEAGCTYLGGLFSSCLILEVHRF